MSALTGIACVLTGLTFARAPVPAEPAPTRLDAEQYFALVDRGDIDPDDRVELLEGVVVSMVPQGSPHANAIARITALLVPLVVALGIDPIHFGVVMTVNIAIGMFTPPFGLNIFVAQSVLGVPLDTIYRGVLPFAAVQIAALLIITYWPGLSLILTTAL